MKRFRLIGFVIAILLGLTAGLLYGWMINPTVVKNTTLDSLRSDYQADYVLMVAENFSIEQDIQAAIALLKHVSPADPTRSVKEALIIGQQMNYSTHEMQALAALEIALSSEVPVSTPQVTP